MSREILQPPGWARPRGYSNGIAAEGRQVFVSGQIGWDAEQKFVSDDFTLQTRQALSNIIEHAGRGGWVMVRRYASCGPGRINFRGSSSASSRCGGRRLSSGRDVYSAL